MHLMFAGIIFVLSFFARESPRWLIKVGRHEEASRTLSHLRQLPEDHPYVTSEIIDINAQLDREREDQDWVLDEVVVTGEESDHKHGSEKGTTTRQSESEHAASLHRGQSGHARDMGQPDTSGFRGYIRYVIVREICPAH